MSSFSPFNAWIWLIYRLIDFHISDSSSLKWNPRPPQTTGLCYITAPVLDFLIGPWRIDLIRTSFIVILMELFCRFKIVRWLPRIPKFVFEEALQLLCTTGRILMSLWILPAKRNWRSGSCLIVWLPIVGRITSRNWVNTSQLTFMASAAIWLVRIETNARKWFGKTTNSTSLSRTHCAQITSQKNWPPVSFTTQYQ